MGKVMQKVKCANCGLLAMVGENQAFIEAPMRTRKEGLQPWKVINPHCFVDAYDLPNEFKETEYREKNPQRRLLIVLDEERDCKRFAQWKQGYTPKEHNDMIQSEALREANERAQQVMRDWQGEQRRLDAERQDKQRRADQERQDKQRQEDQIRQDAQRHEDQARQDRLEKEKQSFQSRLLVYGGILGASLALISFLGGQFYNKFQSKDANKYVPIPEAK
jgi:hypothetical protein